jgi:glycosyltransferase involved in cell wall biosynthesis
LKHIALLIPTVDRIGGAERQLILLAKGLAARGWRVTVVALSGTGGDAAGELAAAGAEYRSLEMRKGLADPRGWIRFHRWLRREKPDVIHAHLPHAALLARWSRLFAPACVLLDTLHSTATGPLCRRLGYRWSAWLPDHVTAVSHAVGSAHLSAAMVSKNRLSVLANGVNVKEWSPDATDRATLRRGFGLTDEFLWLAVGRLEPVKDYATLLMALREVPQPACLVVAGGGPLESQLRRLSKKLGVEKRVRFLGFEPDVRRWMRAADGFVLSSLWEGLPMGLLEAGACGLPAVATNVPGTSEVIVDGQTGLLATAGNATGLASAMNRLMRMPPEERNAMGDRARQLVTERYSLDQVLDRWEALYETRLVGNPRPLRWGRTN